MKDFIRVYAVRATREVGKDSIISFGAPFCAADDESAINAVRNSIKDQIKTGVLDEQLLKHHRVYCIGRYYVSRRSPFSPSRPKPRRVFDCVNFIDNSNQEENDIKNA